MNFKLEENGVPKYRQIISAVTEAIDRGDLKRDSRIPSLNEMIHNYGLSQDTVLNAYNHLKALGIISSQVGKGYYVVQTDIRQKHHIFVLFDNFSFYKEDLFTAMNNTLGDQGRLDLHFHYSNPDVFRQLLQGAAGNYSSYIIMPTLDPSTDKAIKAFLPSRNVYILDRTSRELAKSYPFVCQNFTEDSQSAFNSNKALILKYQRIGLVNSQKRPHFLEIRRGLQAFCRQHSLEYKDYRSEEEIIFHKGDLLVCLSDRVLVSLLTSAAQQRMKAGRDFGIISYNETELKKVVGEGITTLSTDFTSMGQRIIRMILEKKRDRVYNTIKMNIRNST